MSIQTPAEKITAEIAELANRANDHLRNFLICLNAQSQTVAFADNETLAEWLNSRGARLTADLTNHGASGEAANILAGLMEAATGEILPRVDVASFADKLAATGRVATLTIMGWIVEIIPQVIVNETPVDETQPDL
jgi:hypothetical protein